MVSIEEIGPQTLRVWLEEQSPEVLLKLAHRMAARMLPFADPDVWGYPSGGEGGAETRPRCTLSAIRSNLLLQVLSRNDGLIPVDRLEAAIRVAERACLNFGDLFDQNLGEALAIPIVGIVGAAVLRNPGSTYADLDGSGSVFVTTGVCGSVADALARSSPDGKAGRSALLRDNPEWWAIIRSDAASALSGDAVALGQSTPQEAAWATARAAWSERGKAWEFWIRWYEAILAGQAPDWAFLGRVALIPNEVWEKGAAAVAEEIVRIEAELLGSVTPEGDLVRQLALLPPAEQTDVARVRHAMSTYRAELPPTFDAVLGYISLEVERLQARNYRDDEDANEAKRQIGVLTTIYRCVEALKALVPAKAKMSDADAEQAEKLTRLFVRKFKDWPRANSDELVDSTCRGALVGATALMLPLVGVTTPYAVATGMVLFGGKKIADAVKAAKEAMKP